MYSRTKECYGLFLLSVADPGFPVGGRAPVRGVVELQHRRFLVKMYAKTKESGPIGGRVPGTPPRSANDYT